MHDQSYTQLRERIESLKVNRASLMSRVSRIRVDMGKIRRFDLFGLDANMDALETKLRNVMPSLKFLEKDQDQLADRIDIYNKLAVTIEELYAKYQNAAEPLLATVDANQAKVAVLRKRVQLSTAIVESLTLQEARMDQKLRRMDFRMIDINGLVTKVYVDLVVLQQGNFEMAGVTAETESLRTIIERRLAKATTDLESALNRACLLNIEIMELLSELSFIEARVASLFTLARNLGNRLEDLQVLLNDADNSVAILAEYFLIARQKLEAIENYLSTFIVAGDNVYLDFGLDYTTVHAVPPEMPECPDPEPCEDQCAAANVTKKGFGSSNYQVMSPDEESAIFDALVSSTPSSPTIETALIPAYMRQAFKVEADSPIPIISQVKYSDVQNICDSVDLETLGTPSLDLRDLSRAMDADAQYADFSLSNFGLGPVTVFLYAQVVVEAIGQTDISIMVGDVPCAISGVSVSGHNQQFFEVRDNRLSIVQSEGSCTVLIKSAVIIPQGIKCSVFVKGLVMDTEGAGAVNLKVMAYQLADLGCPYTEVFGTVEDGGEPLKLNRDLYGRVTVGRGNVIAPATPVKWDEKLPAPLYKNYTNSLDSAIIGAFILRTGPTSEKPYDILKVDCYHDERSRLESQIEVINARNALASQSSTDFIVSEIAGFEQVSRLYESL